MGRFFIELKRRRVFHVAGVYAVTAWLIAQGAALGETALKLPDWFDAATILLLALGFPIAIIVAWAFEVTPDGVRRTEPDAGTPGTSGGKLTYMFMALVVMAMGWLIFRVEFDGADGPAIAAGDDLKLAKSIAVLPLSNLSPDPDNAYFAAGVHEEILNQLARIEGLRVISRTGVLRFRDTDRSPRDIAAELNVGVIMEGSVRYAGNRVRITTQLIRASDDAHLWSETYDRDLEDIFAIQSDVAIRIAEAMETELLPETRARIEKEPTQNMEAWNLFLRHRDRQHRQVKNWIEPGIRDMQRAVELDPDFAVGQAELGFLYFAAYERQGADTLQLAHEAVDKAIEIDPSQSRAYNVKALLAFDAFDWEAAEAWYQLAFNNNPEPRVYFNYGAMLYASGRSEEASKYVLKAIDLQPEVQYYAFHAGHRINVGDFEGAQAALDALEDLGSDIPVLRARFWLMSGQLERAYESIAGIRPEDILSSDRGSNQGSEIVYFLHKSGHRAEADAFAAALQTRFDSSDLQTVFLPLVIALAADDVDAAFANLNDLVDRHKAKYLALQLDPRFAALRDDPRFDDVLRRMNLSP